MKAYIYHNGIDGNEVSLDVYGHIGGQTFKVPVIDLGRLKTKINRNEGWKQKYEEAVEAVENGKAIDSTKINEYIIKSSETIALKEASEQDGKVYYVDNRYLIADPVHLLRTDNVSEMDPNHSQKIKIKFKAFKIAIRDLLLPFLIFILGILSINYSFILEEKASLPFIIAFSVVLFLAGILLVVKSFRHSSNLFFGGYSSKVDTLRNVINFKVKVDVDGLGKKFKTYTYYFADTDCFRCIPLTKTEYKKFKNKKGKIFGIISDENKMFLAKL